MRFLLSAFFLFLLMIQPAQAREQIRIVGSSTVYPFTATSAEHFGESDQYKTPVVESTGTGGGFKLMCEGVGDSTPDFSNASRPITEKERKLCKKNGVDALVEIPIGYDGIVVANKKGGPKLKLTKQQLFQALAMKLPNEKGELVENHYERWNEIDASLPDGDIQVYGPPPTSGTRDAFAELVLETGCEQYLEKVGYQGFDDKKERKHYCHTIREDGAYVDSGEDDNVIINKLTANDEALGIFGYSYYDNSRAKIQAASIDGIAPTYENVESGKYAVSRSLFVYVKPNHLKTVPGMMAFIRELVSKASIGEEGYNTEKGLLPLSRADRDAMLARVAQLKTYQ
jgi:phosphate transport system substrate-binding protein